MKRKIQKARLTLAAATTAGIHSKDLVKLESGYNKIEKIEMHPIHKSGQSTFGVALRDSSGDIVDSLPINSYETDAGVSPDAKGKTINGRANAQTVYAAVELLANNDGTNDLVVDVVFILVNDPDFDTCE